MLNKGDESSTKFNETPNIFLFRISSYSIGAKIYRKKDNSPEQKLRFLKHNVVKKEVKKF